MTIKGHMVNGKFMDENGRVYGITPSDAEILDSIGKGSDGNNGSNGSNGNGKSKPQTTSPPTPPATPEPAPTLIYPKCISYEIIRAVQTTSFAQVSIRAHCKGQFADAVIHYDFETTDQLYQLDPDCKNPEIGSLEFRQHAMEKAQEEAVEISRRLLCSQYPKENSTK